MKNYPTRDSWFDVAWPQVSYDGDERILVSIRRDTDMAAVEANVADNPNHIFMLLVEDFDLFNQQMPSRWSRMPPDGGIPPNVWVGASFKTQEELDSRAPCLRKIRARKLFLYGKADREVLDIDHELVPWRCMNCGRRGEQPKPTECPSGSLCAVECKIEPQIHWVIDAIPEQEDTTVGFYRECAMWDVALWDCETKEVPE